ncbi:MAG: hypothetical protein ACXV3D_07635 [Halobacteriota archaeon]
MLGGGGKGHQRRFRYLDIVVIVGFVALVGYLIYHRTRIAALMRER